MVANCRSSKRLRESFRNVDVGVSCAVKVPTNFKHPLKLLADTVEERDATLRGVGSEYGSASSRSSIVYSP